MSEAPSPERAMALDYYGEIIAQSNFANASLSFLTVGVSWFMVIYGLSTFLETPKEYRKGRARFLLISLIICLLYSTDAGMSSWGAYQRLWYSQPSGRDYLTHYSRVTNLPWYRRLKTILPDAYIAAGDCLMLYRGFVIWRHRKWVLILPTLTISAHIVLAILSPVELASLDVRQSSLAVILLNVSTNLMITSLIISRLLHTRKAMTQALPDTTPRPMYSDVVAVLIESAAPLAVFGIFCATSQIITMYAPSSLYARARWQGCRSAFALLYYSFCALSPQMVIFRVTTGRSWRGVQDTEDGAPAFSRPIQFSPLTADRASSDCASV